MDCRRPMPSAPSWRPRPIIRWCASPTTRRATCSTPAPMITAPWAWRRAAPSCRPISTCRREWRRARVRWWWWPTAFRRTRLPYRLTRRPAPAFDSRAPVPRGEDMKMGRIIKLALFALCLAGVLPGAASAQGGATCPRPAARSEVTRPPDLYSSGGILNVTFNYFTDVDSVGRPLFCFMTPDGLQSPTLHVNPGETINLTVNNMVPPVPGGPSERMTNDGTICGDKDMTLTSVNVHFHGTNVSPKCHSDEVIRTMINSGQSFTYQIHIPANEPPGLYWYHPHIHGISAMALEGGATGVIEVEGIANIQPAVAGLPERYLVIRDQQIFATSLHRTQSPVTIPTWDLSLNYVPVSFPNYTPAIIKMQSGTQEFWRVANTSANTIIHLKLVYDGEDQPMQIVAFDGVPTGSQDGKHQGTIVTQKDILLAPASRAEFIVSAPPATVKSATLLTLPIDAGPAGDVTTLRPLAHIELSDAPVKIRHAAAPNGPPNLQRFAGLADAKVTAERKLYFSESLGHDEKAPTEPVKFFITVDGNFPKVYDPNNPPDIITNRGAVEEWTIENRSFEVHDFHMHQIHFLVQEVNGVKIPKDQQQFYDTFQVPYWTGEGPYPYIKVKMDFRGAVVGDFVYHCHILDHEDGGMMAIIRVLPKN